MRYELCSKKWPFFSMKIVSYIMYVMWTKVVDVFDEYVEVLVPVTRSSTIMEANSGMPTIQDGGWMAGRLCCFPVNVTKRGIWPHFLLLLPASTRWHGVFFKQHTRWDLTRCHGRERKIEEGQVLSFDGGVQTWGSIDMLWHHVSSTGFLLPLTHTGSSQWHILISIKGNYTTHFSFALTMNVLSLYL